MNKKILIFFLVFIFSISLSNAIKTIEVDETELVSLKPKAIDEDADKLVYSFTEPLDMGGKWQTGYGDEGEYTITITASDGQSSTTMDVLLVVKKKNVGPTIDLYTPEKEEITISEGEGVDFNIKASDLNKDKLVYKWEVDGKVVFENEGYGYKSDYGDAGEHKIIVEVSDGEEEDKKEWRVMISKVDREALLDEIKEVVVDEGDVVKLVLPDFKKYNLGYTISEPIGNDNYWETGYNDSGVYDVEVSIEDRDFSSSEEIKVTVRDMDRKPIFKPIASAWVKENQRVSIELEAYDPDNDKIEFSVENMPKGASLQGNRFEWVVDYDTLKKEGLFGKALDKFHLFYWPFKIRFIAKSKGLEARQSASIIVKDINRAPVLKDIPQITVNEGEEVIIKPEARDDDGDKVVYSYSGWMNSDNYTTDYDDAGIYKVKVVASDGFLTDEKYVTIEVKDKNRAPVFGEIAKMEVKENEKVELKLYASDPDGDSVEISADLPRNSTIGDSTFIWTPEYDTVTADSEVFQINFKVSDDKDETIKQVDITVYNVNRIPKIISASPEKSVAVNKNKKVKFEVKAEDLDNDELTYLWKFGLLEQYKAGSAIVRNFTKPGNKKVEVVVSDGKEKIEYIWRVKVV